MGLRGRGGRAANDPALNWASMLASIAAISAGAALGALLRWGLASRLNAVAPQLPLGTLAANLLGGYCIGLAVAWLAQHPELPPQVRLFIVTGLLGGLTTFSTFSAEVVAQLERGDFAWALLTAAAHLLGSLALTALGTATVRAVAA
jgi:CrcB protein